MMRQVIIEKKQPGAKLLGGLLKFFIFIVFYFTSPMWTCLASSTQCQSLLSQPEEVELLLAVSQLNDLFLKKSLNQRELTEKLKILIQQKLISTSQNQRELKQKEMENTIAFYNQITLTQFKQDLTLKILKQEPWSSKDTSQLERLLEPTDIPVASVKTFLNQQSEILKPFYLYLTQTQGAHWDTEKGWDLSSLQELDVKQIWSDRWLAASLILFASPNIFFTLANPDRKLALPFDQTVFLPPVHTGPEAGKFRVLTLDQYRAEIKQKLDYFSTHVENYLFHSKAAQTELSSILGMLQFRWISKEKVKNIEHERDHAYENILTSLHHLKKIYGVPSDLSEQILATIFASNGVEKQYIQEALAQQNNTETAFWAASAVLLSIYLAPVILELTPVVITAGKAIATRAGLAAISKVLISGGMTNGAGAQLSLAALRTLGVRGLLRTIPFALPGQKAAVTLGFGLPLSFGLLTAGLHASADSFLERNHFWCSFKTELPKSLPEAMAAGGWLAFIPTGGAIVKGVSTGISGVAALGQAAQAVYQLLVGTVLSSLMVKNGIQNYKSSNQLEEVAFKEAQNPGKQEVVNALAAEALKRRFDAGIDFGFVAGGITRPLKAGFESLSRYRSANRIQSQPGTTRPQSRDKATSQTRTATLFSDAHGTRLLENPSSETLSQETPVVRFNFQIPAQNGGKPIAVETVTANLTELSNLNPLIHALTTQMKTDTPPAETIIVIGTPETANKPQSKSTAGASAAIEEQNAPPPDQVAHIAEAITQAGLAKKVAHLVLLPPSEKNAILKNYWETNHHRVVLSLVRLGISTGASTLAIVITYNTPLLQALQASIGLGVLSAAFNFWGNDIYKYVIQGDFLTHSYARKNQIEIKTNDLNKYTDPRLETLATWERRLYYFLTEVSFIGTGAGLRSAAEIHSPHQSVLANLFTGLVSTGLTVASQGEWDVQCTQALEKSTRKLSIDFIEKLKIKSYDNPELSLEAEQLLIQIAENSKRPKLQKQSYEQLQNNYPELRPFAELIRDISQAQWNTVYQLKTVDAELGRRYQTALNLFQVNLFLGSAISVAAMVASMGPMENAGYLGFGLLTAMGYSLKYRNIQLNDATRELIHSLEHDLQKWPILTPPNSQDPETEHLEKQRK